MQTLKLTSLCITIITFLVATDGLQQVLPPVLCSISNFPSKPDLGLSGSIVVSPRAKGGIYITGFLQNAPASTTGIIFIGTDADCSSKPRFECVETDDDGRKEDLCLGGHEIGGKSLWNKMTFTSDSSGAAFVAIMQPNMEFSAILNRCVIVEAADKTRIGCGELKTV